MFDMSLKPKFYVKSKMYIKLTKSRLETILKKRKSVQRYLKNDIAEMLKSNLDFNAFRTAEGLLVEQNMTSCYEQIETFCGCILEHSKVLENKGEFPDECKEAIQCIIYAAARLADLPELRDLRTLFTEKYGNTLDSYVNKKFVQKLRFNAPTKEMKIHLLHDIAQENSINWDSKPLEQKLYKPPPLEQGKLNHTYFSFNDEELNQSNEDKFSQNKTLGEWIKLRKGKHTSSSNETEVAQTGFRLQRSSSSTDNKTSTDMSSQDDQKTGASSAGGISGKPIKPSAVADKEQNHDSDLPVVQDKPKSKSVTWKNLKPSPAHENVAYSASQDAQKLDKGETALENVKGSQAASKDDSDLMDEKKRKLEATLTNEFGKTEEYAKAHQLKIAEDYRDESSISRKSKYPVPPARAVTLPTEGTKSTEGYSSVKTRVHPKLPDYDDLAARFAALRGN